MLTHSGHQPGSACPSPTEPDAAESRVADQALDEPGRSEDRQELRRRHDAPPKPEAPRPAAPADDQESVLEHFLKQFRQRLSDLLLTGVTRDDGARWQELAELGSQLGFVRLVAPMADLAEALSTRPGCAGSCRNEGTSTHHSRHQTLEKSRNKPASVSENASHTGGSVTASKGHQRCRGADRLGLGIWRDGTAGRRLRSAASPFQGCGPCAALGEFHAFLPIQRHPDGGDFLVRHCLAPNSLAPLCFRPEVPCVALNLAPLPVEEDSTFATPLIDSVEVW
jgi:hypothetical protein